MKNIGKVQKRKSCKNYKKNFNSQKGITLVTLVITIIILIILATVAISFAFGSNGLITKAQLASEMYANDTKYTDESIANVEGYLNDMISGTGSSEDEDEDTQEEPKVPDMSEAKPNPGEDGPKYSETTEIKDDEENIVVIPGGFHLDAESGTRVEDGIVIEDDSGNQFVWIPTGTYQTSSGEKTNELSRRTFTSAGSMPVSGDSVIDSYFYGEGDSRSIAYSQIGEFKASAESTTNGGHGGFYIGRYEQGTGNVCKAGVVPYVNITRDTAKSQAEAMYSGNSNIVSELISSYAWDTALNFICQTNSAGYTLATTTSSSYGNIGTGISVSNRKNTGEDIHDNYSNIHDLLGNCCEWTTEYSSPSNGPCTVRGGFYYNSNLYAAYRYPYLMNASLDNVSARIQLYVK